MKPAVGVLQTYGIVGAVAPDRPMVSAMERSNTYAYGAVSPLGSAFDSADFH